MPDTVRPYLSAGQYLQPQRDPLDDRRKLVQAMFASAMRGGPVPGVVGGLARLGEAGAAAWGQSRLDAQQKEADDKRMAAFEAAGNETDPAAAVRGMMKADPQNAHRYAPYLVQALFEKQKQDEQRRVNAVMAGQSGNSTDVPRETPVPSGAPSGPSQNPSPPPGEGRAGGFDNPGGTLAAGTVRDESGGNPQAVNPATGAFGKYQFLPSTAAALAKANPQLGLPDDVRQWTSEHQDAAFQAFTAGNAASMAPKLGRQPTAGELRLAHYFGAGGATGLLSLDPNTPFDKVPDGMLGTKTAEVLRVNPNLQGMKVGDLIARYRRQYDGPSGEPQQVKEPLGQRNPYPDGSVLAKVWANQRQPGSGGALGMAAPQGPAFPGNQSAEFDSTEAPAIQPVPGAGVTLGSVLGQGVGADPGAGTPPPATGAAVMPVQYQPGATQPTAPTRPQGPQIDPGAHLMAEAQKLAQQANQLEAIRPDMAAKLREQARALAVQAEDRRMQYRVQQQTREDARAAAVPQGYRHTPDGGLEPIPGGPADPKVKQGNKALGQGTIDKLTEAGGRAVDMTRLANTFDPKFAGYGSGTAGDVVNFAKRNFGDNTGQAQWWQDYQATKNAIRHGMFGAALTPTEKAEFEKQTINPGMAPSQVQQNLARQQRLVMVAAARIAQTWIKQGHAPDAIEAALGIPLSQLPDPTASYDDATKGGGAPAGPAKPAGGKIRIDADGNRL